MRNLLFRKPMVDTEREIVKAEIRQQENSPIAKGFLRFLEVAFTKHPYAWTAGGKSKDLDATTPGDLKKFYDAYYQPNNAMLVVVGKTTLEQVEASAEKWFGAIAKAGRAAAAGRGEQEPAQTTKRREVVEPGPIGVTLIGWHIPAAQGQGRLRAPGRVDRARRRRFVAPQGAAQGARPQDQAAARARRRHGTRSSARIRG